MVLFLPFGDMCFPVWAWADVFALWLCVFWQLMLGSRQASMRQICRVIEQASHNKSLLLLHVATSHKMPQVQRITYGKRRGCLFKETPATSKHKQASKLYSKLPKRHAHCLPKGADQGAELSETIENPGCTELVRK